MRRKDYYAELAKKKGYPARSVFKLQEMQKRFRIVKPGFRILDIGSSPGSWSQFCLEILSGRGKVVGVDLIKQALFLKSKGNYHFIEGSIFLSNIERRIVDLGPYDLILSDAAPATSGNRTVDTQASLNIGYKVLQIVELSLVRGGGLVVKIFQGGGEGEYLKNLRRKFEKVRIFKPQASRKGSKEVFFLGFGLK